MAISASSGTGGDDMMIDINTTPLIDVMLVLLIMFIITIPIQTHAVKMNLPVPSNAAQAPKPPEEVRISVAADGTIEWNDEIVQSRADLEKRLWLVARQPEQPEVHLRPSKLVPYKHVAGVMAAAQRLGVVKIGLVGSEQFASE
ncbi:biopolymer transporter ExbD [Variovorax sp. E3]|jgi:biopolymer transport protein ExbD|uniref:ExbD/TolR family protein n=1 Tax=Variovorax sp. E3 TaxID=1914993 RepID=UPI0018DE0D60|nr:biopolymer transporter ExbD [Variovorax sp. E3]